MQRTLKNEKSYRTLFEVAALYDYILGLVFFIFLPFFFENIFKIPAPNYPAFFGPPEKFRKRKRNETVRRSIQGKWRPKAVLSVSATRR